VKKFIEDITPFGHPISSQSSSARGSTSWSAPCRATNGEEPLPDRSHAAPEAMSRESTPEAKTGTPDPAAPLAPTADAGPWPWVCQQPVRQHRGEVSAGWRRGKPADRRLLTVSASPCQNNRRSPAGRAALWPVPSGAAHHKIVTGYPLRGPRVWATNQVVGASDSPDLCWAPGHFTQS